MQTAYNQSNNGTLPHEEEIERHELEMPDLPFESTLYPWGFPLHISSNSREALRQCGELWGQFGERHDAEPVHAEVWVLEGEASECPPSPVHRLISGMWLAVADTDNYGVLDLVRCESRIVLTESALAHPLYAKYFLLGLTGCCVVTRHMTPVHAACVELDGRGVLLCGESGTGKSTLAFACASAGWTYVTDDATMLINDGDSRQAHGDCHQIRFRPSAAELFPQLAGLGITPRAAGKPSVEVQTGPLPEIRCAETAHADFIVFLNRDWSGPAEIVPYSKSAARKYMRRALQTPRQMRLMQHKTIDRLLECDVLELRYEEMDDAVERLRVLVREGR
jgi:energy-coupling factor transporter ATP-binding protein EcfA2